jgi:hypothetical protein
MVDFPKIGAKVFYPDSTRSLDGRFSKNRG